MSKATDKDIAKFWAYMAHMFGSRWVSSYGAKPNYAWQQQLSKMDKKQISHGTEAVLRAGLEYPPTLPQFLTYCKDAHPSRNHLPPGYKRPALTHDQRANTCKPIKEHIADMKEKVGLKP